MHVLSAKEIAEYIHEEHTPYSCMPWDEGKAHIAELIQRLVNSELAKQKEEYEMYYNKSGDRPHSIHGG